MSSGCFVFRSFQTLSASVESTRDIFNSVAGVLKYFENTFCTEVKDITITIFITVVIEELSSPNHLDY